MSKETCGLASSCEECGHETQLPVLAIILKERQDQIASLTESLRRAEDSVKDCAFIHEQDGKDIDKLKSALEVARKALEFYQEVENWHRYKDGKRVYVHTDMPESFAVMDYGKQAKVALAAIDKALGAEKL